MRIFVVEDEPMHLENAKMNIDKAGYELVGEAMDADSSFDKIRQSQPDVVLIDIALPGLLNGISLGEKINKELSIPHIFITSFTEDEVIKQAIATNPKRYLKKPIDITNLKAAIELAVAKRGQSPTTSFDLNEEGLAKPGMILTKVGDRLIKIPVDKIKYIKADGENYTSIFSENREYSCRTTIKKILQELPANFIQIHRSVVVNIHFLDEINERTQVCIVEGKELAIGRKYRKNLLAAFSRL